VVSTQSTTRYIREFFFFFFFFESMRQISFIFIVLLYCTELKVDGALMRKGQRKKSAT
jgi:hypothetical protein